MIRTEEKDRMMISPLQHILPCRKGLDPVKRSFVNRAIDEAIRFFDAHQCRLPPFAYFSPADWAKAGRDYDPVRRCMLGWDLTDFGFGDFEHTGLLLFTLRNGRQGSEEDPKPYAEKLMLVHPGQRTPYHFHLYKMEDIINRGGGLLNFRFFRADENEGRSEEPVRVLSDGRMLTLEPEEVLSLRPGESVTVPRRVYHEFWAEEGDTIAGEVSQVNDDNTDNRFFVPCGRFPAVEEDEPARYLLCNEYPAAAE